MPGAGGWLSPAGGGRFLRGRIATLKDTIAVGGGNSISRRRGPVEPAPLLRPARHVRGFVLADACRAYEFRVAAWDESGERVGITAEVVHAETLRDFYGFNRAKHAVVETAILATRTDFLPLAEIEAEYRKLEVIVNKTGGAQEQQAFALLRDHVAGVRQARESTAQERPA